MTVKMRKVRALECDGCGYDVSELNATKLELTYILDDKTRGKLVLHFHPVREDQDCLRYFILNRHMLKRVVDEASLPLSEKAKDLLLQRVPMAK